MALPAASKRLAEQMSTTVKGVTAGELNKNSTLLRRIAEDPEVTSNATKGEAVFLAEQTQPGTPSDTARLETWVAVHARFARANT
jgi:hypothetical protein